MISKTLTVVNPSGLHLRPAGVLSQTAMKFKSDITIECGEKKIVAKSVLNVMAAGIKCGTEITLVCDGEDEQAAMDTLSQATSFYRLSLKTRLPVRLFLEFPREPKWSWR